MSKLVKGYLITATFFMETDPNDFNTTIRVADAINTVKSCIGEFDAAANVAHKYVQRREVPDAAVAVTQTTADMPRTIVEPFREAVAMERMPEIPAAQRRS